MSDNLFLAFERILKPKPDTVLMVLEDGRELSRKTVLDLSAQMANLLQSSGLQPGDRVSVQIDKSAAGVCLYLACLRAGLVFHPLNTAYQKNELHYFLSNAEPKAVISSAPYGDVLQSLCDEFSIAHHWQLNADNTGSFLAACGNQSTEFATVERSKNDLAALLYSSGTTGRPKGIMLSHGNMQASAQVLTQAWGFTEADTLLHVLPVFHVHGLFVAIHCVLMSGARMVFLPKFELASCLAWMPKVTVMMGVPTYYVRLLDSEFSPAHCANVRLFISGSAPLLSETFIAFEQRTGQRILERYGMTETNMNTSNPLKGERRAGTVGPALPGTSVRVVNDAGDILGAGEVGHIQVKGANVFQGYWRMPEKTAEDFTADGYFNTGDNGVLSNDGYLSIIGRAKDMIITGGLNVYPKEIELLIDALEGVVESAVIGVPHPDFGEAVIAVVVAEKGCNLSAQEIEMALKELLANFKRPKRVIMVNELPRNTMGKVQKALLRDQYSAVLSTKV